MPAGRRGIAGVIDNVLSEDLCKNAILARSRLGPILEIRLDDEHHRFLAALRPAGSHIVEEINRRAPKVLAALDAA
jgi:hypothetical protein